MADECLYDPLTPITPPEDDPGYIDCDCDAINRELQSKQEKLIAGTGITISGTVISSTGGGGGGTAGVTSFNGRIGGVVPVAGDYNATQIRAQDGRTVQNYIDEYNNNQPDAVMSSTSQKAVQNKVVKAYVDAIDVKTLPPGGSTGDILAKIDGQNYNAHWINGNNFMKKTDYDTNNDGKVDISNQSDALKSGGFSVTAPAVTANTTTVVQSQVGRPSGVVPLDANGKILPQYLPDNIMSGLTYGGVFDADTRTVRLTPAAKSILEVTTDTLVLENSSAVPAGYPANAPLFYVTTNGGTFAGMTFDNGDWLMSLETEWQQLKNGTSGVSSWNGLTGVVEATTDVLPQGMTNLYMTQAEKDKLDGIESNATRDTDVIQTASVTSLPDGTQVLRLVNKNGDVTSFLGNAAAGDFLTRTGNASETYIVYTPTGERTSFTGGELTGEFARKVVDWLSAIESVAFTGDYTDLTNRPVNVSSFYNDGNGTNPYITRTNADLLNYYLKTEVYTRTEVDNLLGAVGHMNFYVVEQLPDMDIDTGGIYYIQVDPSDPSQGYNRYQYIQGRWIFLGTTDIQFSDYLLKNGDASNVTSSLSVYTTRELLTGNDKLKEALGKINYWLSQMKEICFTADWTDLENADELATQEDLEEYVKKLWPRTEAGKVLGIDPTGEVTAIDMGAVEAIQYEVMPTAGSEYQSKVFQFTGVEGEYKTGVWYECREVAYYGWLQDRTSNQFYTLDYPPAMYDRLYDDTFTRVPDYVTYVSTTALTDNDGDTYTRNTTSDETRWEWVPLQTTTGDLENNGNGTGNPEDYFVTRENTLVYDGDITTAGDATTVSDVGINGRYKKMTLLTLWNYITSKLNGAVSTIKTSNLTNSRALISNGSGKVAVSSVTSTELGYLSGVTSAIQTQLNDMWKKIYPVGSIYISATNGNPQTLFGGTWSLIGDGRVLWGVSSSTTPGSTLAAQLPNISGTLDFSSGSQGHSEVNPGGAFYKAENWSGTYPQPVGGSSTTGPRKIGFKASNSNSTYVDNGVVRPAAYTVHFWRRTA